MPDTAQHATLPFDPGTLPRELKRHYISASDEDIKAMLDAVGANNLAGLFKHIPEANRFDSPPELPDELSYEAVQEQMAEIAAKNRRCESFIGDGLPDFSVHEIVPFVSSIRNLTTAYTPYQPERSQGTLISHWIYQCLMTSLTGFEAINSSLYDRSTAIFEAICTAVRLQRKADTAIIPEALYPPDLEVLDTLAEETGISLVKVPLDVETGRISIKSLKDEVDSLGDQLAAVVFPQVNALGILEDVDALTDFCNEAEVKSIAVIDPMLLGTGGLKPPVEFGKEGADMIVGEGQHLAIGPNFGGPGLGIFGIRFNNDVKNAVRHTPGRYVGKAKDINGRDCRVMVLSTREQHIRKEKATSNICSNQAFLATLAGAAILARGESGMSHACNTAREQAHETAKRLTAIPGIELAWPDVPFFNEFVITLPESISAIIKRGSEAGLHVGVDVSDRIKGDERPLLKLSFSDQIRNIDRLVEFFEEVAGVAEDEGCMAEIPERLLRRGKSGLPEFALEEIKTYYSKLGELNVSPDSGCYPLGSCTMKYNPYLNDWAASLSGFTGTHPQAPLEDAQGCLEVLFEIQVWFKKITGLHAVTTQPVAGAQGELTGLKLFQAYHRSNGDLERNVVLIPKSAHGTNFATAAMAGFANKTVEGKKAGIVFLEADERGGIDMEDFSQKVAEFGTRICGVMITNPNTSGIFETAFAEIARKIHEVGGLVYMDGANMNAIAGWVDLGALGVDAVHQNLHKTWTIPHGGGGPGDAVVAVSKKLADFLPGYQVVKYGERFDVVKPAKSIGSFHRHWGNFAHKVRCYTYLLRLGREGVRRMSAMAVLSARYLYEQLRLDYPTLPEGADDVPRMHEFILTLAENDFEQLEAAGVPRAVAVTRLGKLFLDFGFHAPTVAWPEAFGVMIEPTESYTKAELDRFGEAVLTILKLLREKPATLNETPFFTPVDRIDEVDANRHLCLSEKLEALPPLHANRVAQEDLEQLSIEDIYRKLIGSS